MVLVAKESCWLVPFLGHAVVKDGKWVAESNSYGAAARGGSCRADVVISQEAAMYPHLTSADVLIALSQKAYDSCISEVKDNALIIYDGQSVSPQATSKLNHLMIPANKRAIQSLNSRQVEKSEPSGQPETCPGG